MQNETREAVVQTKSSRNVELEGNYHRSCHKIFPGLSRGDAEVPRKVPVPMLLPPNLERVHGVESICDGEQRPNKYGEDPERPTDSKHQELHNGEDEASSRLVKFVRPSSPLWVADDSVSKCMICAVVTFGLLNRRHHCRTCGRVVCNGCSKKRVQSKRVCDECIKNIPKHEIPDSIWTASTRNTQQKAARSSPSEILAPSPFSHTAITNLNSNTALDTVTPESRPDMMPTESTI